MKNKSESISLTALLVVALVCAGSAAPIAAQTTEKSPPPFGSSLKRPRVNAGRQVKEPAAPKAVADEGPQPEEIIKIDTSLVNLDVLVTDANRSRYISGLTKDDFVVIEDEQSQTVATLTIGDDAERLPRSIVLILDRSQSEFPYLEASVQAAKTLINQLAPSDEMAIVTDDVHLAIGFTNDKTKLKKTLDALKKWTFEGYHSRSKQFSALLATLRELIDTSKKRPIIIFQTDGDEAPRWEKQRPADYDLNTVYAEVAKSRTKIFTVIPNVRLIGIPPEEIPGRISLMQEKSRLARSKHKDMWFGYERLPPLRTQTNTNSSKSIDLKFSEMLRGNILAAVSDNLVSGQTAAARVADLTGGWTSFLEQQEQAQEIYGRILADINNSYIVSYYPTNKDMDARLRKVRIEVRGHPEYVVHGRTSYYAIPR